MQVPQLTVTGLVVVITGASRGIGRGLASILAQAGAIVVATARRAEDVTELVKDIRAAGGEALAIQLDVRSVADIRRAFDTIEQAYGRIDVLINNAGVGANHDAVDLTEDDWDDMLDVNLKGLFFCCQAAGIRMLAQKCGRIINLSSQAGLVGIERHSAYSASKGGVNMLTKVLALEWGPSGVTVNAIAPTFIYTPGTAERLDQPEFHDSVVSRIPVGHVGTIEDVAAAILYLASPAASLVNGTILTVDGGWTAR